MTTLFKESPDAKIIPKACWQTMPNAYICRTEVRRDGSGFYATAIRLPELTVRGNSEDEARNELREAFRNAIESRRGRVGLKPLRDMSVKDLLSASAICVEVNSPSIHDIDAAYEDTELSDEQASELECQRLSGSAKPTVPLVRINRK